MPTIGSVTKTVRIAPRDLEVINALMADGTSWSGAIHKLCAGVPAEIFEKSELSLNKWGIDEKILEDMATMIPFMGESVAEMIRLMDAALNEGVITYENGRYIGTPEIYLDDLKEACHERGIGMQEAIDKTVKSLRSGK